MTRNNLTLVVLVAIFSALTTFLLLRAFSPEQTSLVNSTDMSEPGEDERGPNGGRLLGDDNFSLEIVIYEGGIPPEFHIYGYRDGAPISVDQFSSSIELVRLGGIRDTFSFVAEGEYLRGLGVVREPHSFDVLVSAESGGKNWDWEYESYEGRTTITDRIAIESGISSSVAGPQQIVNVVELTGAVQADPGRVSEVRARFSGIVTEIMHNTGDYVVAGETLGAVETNASLSSVPVVAPISGLIVNRSIQVGQVTGADPLFVIADLSEVWVQMDVFGNDLASVSVGQPATISSLDGTRFSGDIEWISPLIAHGSQSVRARIPLKNPDGALRVGQFVRAQVTVAKIDVPLAVQRSALQTFRDFDVVYAKVDDTYEVRMLELGNSDNNFVEVLGGLMPGEIYVSGNSYLIKADIEKSGASHDH